MPRIARTFIKTGMVFFLISLLLGIAVEIESLSLPVLMPLFWHTLMVGWITQIIFGVSMWMFPGRTKEEGFKAQLWGWLTYIFLNTGLVLRLVAEPMLSYSELTIWNLLVLGSAVLQVSGGFTYLTEMWPRIMSKEQRRQKRKKKRRKQ
ncbi:hypothetical protein [Fodinibius sediminis]|uniref:Cytochrome C and Quinol oxidase polypeptide I n=1 Tax=Fodinibius sediminis TaxID=1214077 RepID=A0A521ERU4_9BACT|nr:hypothetical protein [Fodinibius sediminis]SMO86635.1 hypothetical protein SAMN06265218_11866 [Fodinibius sediminis]